MALQMLRGDLLAAPQRVIAHGCNARGVMGAGIAKAVRAAYPGAYQVYRDKFEREGLVLGEIVPWTSPSRVVLNCITQENFGRAAGVRYVDYGAVRHCMRRIENSARKHLAAASGVFHEDPGVAMSRIGSSLGGGDWDEIRAIIEEEITSIEVFVYTL